MTQQLMQCGRRAIAGILTLTLVAALLLPLLAVALPADTEAQAETLGDITPFSAITFYLRRMQTTYVAAVTGELDPEVELPVTVEIAIPAGAQIIWFGQRSDGNIVFDPQIEEPHNIRRDGNLDIYTATLTDHHKLQIEYHPLTEPVTQLGNGDYAVAMDYTPLTDLLAVRMITNLPLGSVAHDAAIEFFGNNEEGDPQLGYIFWDTPALQSINANIIYTPPAGQGMPTNNNVMDGLIVVIATLIVVAGAAVAVILIKRRPSGSE
ncbi:MAG: hypothetical protein FWF11_04165 [Coriobacteriia bacterium]|nr:hypothetical protein [Coriobacteriia bacterium]